MPQKIADPATLATVRRDEETAPYEQVRSQIAAQVASGELAPGTRLPTVRALAQALGLAANTVARVYKELEADGVVLTRGRNGTVVRPTGGPDGDRGPAVAAAQQAATDYVHACRALGLTVGDAVRLVEDGWQLHD